MGISEVVRDSSRLDNDKPAGVLHGQYAIHLQEMLHLPHNLHLGSQCGRGREAPVAFQVRDPQHQGGPADNEEMPCFD